MKRMNLDSGSDFIAFLQTSSNSLWVPSSSSPSFHETMVKFNQEGLQGGEEEMEKKAFEQQEKKRRLSPHQVHFLEKNFEVENKLEPERKVQLAIELGLQPRQVAIWFQNRRARFKTKQLEKDYGSLKASYDRLKANFDTLIKDRDDLQIQAKLLMKKLKERDMGRENSDPNNPKPEEVTKIEVENMGKMGEDVSSAKSGVFDSESPHYYTEPAMDSTGMADPDRPSDSPLYDDDMDKKSLVLPPTLAPLFSNSSLVDKSYDTNLTSSFSPVDDPSVWSWLC